MERLSQKYAVEHLGIDPASFLRPVKVVQFGTGVLLRGLVDFIFQKANDQGDLVGQIAMVRSTSSDISEFEAQDGIYTVVETGLNELQEISIHSTLVHCVNPVWSAEDDQLKLIDLFASPFLKIAVSNTTEMGLSYREEPVLHGNPKNFPANLTALLYHRYQTLGDSLSTGLVVIPTELIAENGQLLKRLVKQHAGDHALSIRFIQWLDEACNFCDSLVDRIVPGKFNNGANGWDLPYEDNLAIQTEPYFLWAIQSNSVIPELDFKHSIPGLVITPDIQPYREQKLRLLNGGHTIVSPLAYLLGCRTVEQLMMHEQLNSFVCRVCETEIIPTLESLAPQAKEFYQHMKRRWSNPFIKHALTNILGQTTTKMQLRNGENMIRYYAAKSELPPLLSFGFAAYIFMFRPRILRFDQYYMLDPEGDEVEINDSKAEGLYHHWKPYFNGEKTMAETITVLLNDHRIFDHPFVLLPGFKEKITTLVQSFELTGLQKPLLTILNAVPLHV